MPRVALCVSSALLCGSVSQRDPQLAQLQGCLWESCLFSQQSVSMPSHPTPAQKRETVMVKELYLSGHSSGCHREKEFHTVISGPLSHVNEYCYCHFQWASVESHSHSTES